MLLPGSSVTAARKKVYPRHFEGRFRKLRNAISLSLQALLFLLPWWQWQGRQAVLIDISGRKLYLWGLVLHPQDTYFLHLLLISGALTLFFVSAIAGRMWCGYACPQTVLTQAFIMVERWWEGDRAARIRLDRAPWNAEKSLRKFGKRATWLAMGGFLGLTMAGYFMPIRGIVADLLAGSVSPTTASTVGFFTVLSMFDFGYFREQFCCYVCPYARFQGAMLDSESLIIGYDEQRGEPRGKLKAAQRGSCIDCSACVQACPMGIDIRKGLQLECIACAACMDACDQVMDRIDQPRGLIRYTSQSGERPKVLRPRVIVYAGLLLGLGGLLAYLLLNRAPLGVDAIRVIHPGGQLAGTTPDGHVTNTFKLNLINRTATPTQLWLETEGLKGAQVIGVSNPLSLASGEVSQAQVIVMMPPGTGRGVFHFYFKAHDQKDLHNRKEATFVVP